MTSNATPPATTPTGTDEYDVIVVGAGQAGPGVAAARAQAGQRVAMIEMAEVGGTCLNHGCKPTKALRATATVAHTARRAADYGVHTGEISVDFGFAIRRVHTMIDAMRASLAGWVEGVENLDLITGTATLQTDRNPGPDRRHRVQVGDRTLTAPEVYLNVGSRAGAPPIPGLDDVSYLTEVELLQLTELPEHLVIVGGGYIGLEFGQMFRRFGSEVTMLVGSGVATREDADVSQLVADLFTGEGVDLRYTRPARVAAEGGGVRVELEEGEPVTGSHLLVATGRRSNSDLLGDHGVDTDEGGFFVIDHRFQTSVPGVWALGDVNGHGAFTHTAYQDSQIMLDPDRSLDGRITAYAMFTDPPLGRVGMTVEQARRSGRNVLKAEVPMSSVSRAILESETEGLMRILVDADSQQFLGATIIGLHADDLVQIIGLAMQTGITYPQVQHALPIHPTMAEFIPSMLGSLAPLD